MAINQGDQNEAPRILNDRFLTVKQVGELLGISRGKVYGLMNSGELRFAKFGKSRRIPAKALNEFVERSMVGEA